MFTLSYLQIKLLVWSSLFRKVVKENVDFLIKKIFICIKDTLIDVKDNIYVQ